MIRKMHPKWKKEQSGMQIGRDQVMIGINCIPSGRKSSQGCKSGVIRVMIGINCIPKWKKRAVRDANPGVIRVMIGINCIPKWKKRAVRDANRGVGREFFEADCIPKPQECTVRDANRVTGGGLRDGRPASVAAFAWACNYEVLLLPHPGKAHDYDIDNESHNDEEFVGNRLICR